MSGKTCDRPAERGIRQGILFVGEGRVMTIIITMIIIIRITGSDSVLGRGTSGVAVKSAAPRVWQAISSRDKREGESHLAMIIRQRKRMLFSQELVNSRLSSQADSPSGFTSSTACHRPERTWGRWERECDPCSTSGNIRRVAQRQELTREIRT